jgi:hypothetical protein
VGIIAPESADNIYMAPDNKEEDDPILKMCGVGKEIWADVDADEYVRSLRANWYGNASEADTSDDQGPDSADLE